MSITKLYDVLSSISAGQKTGNLVFLVKEASSKRGVSTGTFAFDKGKLFRATFQQQTGRDAVSALLATNIPDMDFDVNFKEFPVTSEPDSGIPLIADLMQQMKAKDQPERSPNINLQRSAKIDTGPSLISSQSRAVLQDTLAEYVGPIAILLCRSSLLGVQDMETALEVLAMEIPHPHKARQFKERVRQKLATVR